MAKAPTFADCELEKAARKRRRAAHRRPRRGGPRPALRPGRRCRRHSPSGLPSRRPHRFQKAHRKKRDEFAARNPRQRRGLGHRRRRRGNHRPHQHPPGLAAGHAHWPSSSSRSAPDFLLIDGRDPSTGPARSRPSSRATPPASPSPPPACWPRSIATACSLSWTAVIPATASPATKAMARPQHLAALCASGPHAPAPQILRPRSPGSVTIF